MRVDPTTLADLEVFGDRAGRSGLLGLVDRTATGHGRKALHRRLEAPPSDVGAIRRVQDAVRFLAALPAPLAFPPRPAAAVERYLDSNLETVRATSGVGAALQGLALSLRYRDVLREMRDGIQATGQMVGALGMLCRTLERESPPALVAGLVDELASIVAELAPWTNARTWADVVRADRRFRRDARDRLRRAIDLMGELDALHAMAAATSRLGWAFPELVASDAFHLEGEGLWHPFLPGAVRNPVRISGGEPLVFLTGPNMAGKTTYLRCVALCVLLAQAGMGVPAARLRLTPVEVLLTSLNPADDVRAGLSFFLAEVHRVRTAAELLAEGRRAFVVFDEVFKGTNVRDALEASAAVILGFARARGSGFVFSSHLVELAETLRAEPRIRFHYFDGAVVEGEASYPYRIREGVSDRRLGLHLLREARIPELLARIAG